MQPLSVIKILLLHQNRYDNLKFAPHFWPKPKLTKTKRFCSLHQNTETSLWFLISWRLLQAKNTISSACTLALNSMFSSSHSAKSPILKPRPKVLISSRISYPDWNWPVNNLIQKLTCPYKEKIEILFILVIFFPGSIPRSGTKTNFSIGRSKMQKNHIWLCSTKTRNFWRERNGCFVQNA